MRRRDLRGVFRGLFIISLVAAAVTVSQASPITYTVNQTIGMGSVTGFIETDGTTGVLFANNFINWNLLLNDGKNTFRLTGPLSGNNSQVFIQGTDVAAFGNFLFFNFSAIDYGILLFSPQSAFTGAHYYCDASQPFMCPVGATVVPLTVTQGFQNVRFLGNVVIGVKDAAAPEPGTLGLLLFGVGWLGRRLKPRI